MSEKTLKFDNIKVNKKEFHKSKQAIDLNLINVDQMAVSDRFRHNDEGFKYFIGYQEDGIIKPLCIILPQINGYRKYFENGGKNMSFMIKDNNVLNKYNKIWNVIKNKIVVTFHSEPIYGQIYIKAKVREFDGVIKTNLLGNDVPKENIRYICIACITIDYVMRTDKQYFPQVYLEECKYKIKKIQISRFINTELKSDSDLRLDLDSKKYLNSE